MFDIAFKRLFWKELRTQSQIWLALLAGTILLQLLFLGFGREFQQSYIHYPLEVAVVLTVCFALTSVAVLFAGEREESTDEWLQTLPIKPSHLLVGKLSFSVTSVVLFAAVAIGAGIFVKEMAPLASSRTLSDWWDQTGGFLRGSALLVLWGVFYSLILSRVMSVLVAAVATQLLLAAFVGNSNLLPGKHEYWMLGIGICAAIADVWLGKQWLSGRSVVPAFEGTRVATDRRSRFWLRKISRAAVRTPLSARTTSVMIWRELRGAVPFAVGWALAGIPMVDLLVRARSGLGTNFCWMFATPVVCGILTCAGDNWRNTFRFLTDRGVSPRTVWLTKHAVWFSLAVGLILLFGGYDLLVHDQRGIQLGLGDHPSTWTMLGEPLRVSYYERTASMFLSEMQWRRLSLAGSLLLSLYAVGHLCSLWFRRVVVSACIALVCSLIVLAWHLVSAAIDIRPVIAVWPLTIALVAASVVTVGGWLHEVAGWRYRVRQTAWVLVPVAGVVLGTINARPSQIPQVSLSYDYHATFQEMERFDSAWTSRWRIALANVQTNFTPYFPLFQENKQRWFESDLQLREATRAEPVNDTEEVQGEADAGSGSAGTSELSGDFRSGVGTVHDPWQDILEDPSARETLDQLVALAGEIRDNGSRNIDPDLWRSRVSSANQIMMIGPVLAAAARRYQETDDLEAAWETIQAGYRITKYLQLQLLSVSDLQGVWETQEVLMQAEHEWAAHLEQTVESIRRALETSDNTFYGLQQVRERRYAYLRSKIEAYPDGDSSEVFPDWSSSPFFALTWPERWRVIRLMTAIEAGHTSTHHQRPQYQQYNWPWVTPQITSEHIERWVATTPLLPHEYYLDHAFDFQPILTTHVATRLVLMLHLHRLEHGAFPAHLHELDGQVPRDPITGGDFGYSPEGFDAPAVAAWGEFVDNTFIIPTGTPLLWSPATLKPEAKLDGELLMLQRVEFGDHSRYQALKELAEQRFSGRESDVTDQPTRRLLYIHVGQRPW